MKPITNITDPRYVKALSHPLRVRILALLEDRVASPRQLADSLETSIGVVAYHVRTLEQLGLIELVRETPVRGAIEHYYRSRRRPRVSDRAWSAAPPIVKQAAIGASLQMVHEYAAASAAAGGFDKSDAHLSRSSVRLDKEGWEQLAKACERLLTEVDEISEASAKRSAGDPHSLVDVGLVMMLFEGVSIGNSGKRRRSTRRAQRSGRATSSHVSQA